MNIPHLRQVVFEAVDELPSVALILLRSIHCHLSYFRCGGRERNGDHTSNQIQGLVKESEMPLALFHCEVRIGEA